MSKQDGGPAFPSTVRREEKYMDECGYGHTRIVSTLEGGMTLRDWFAGQALVGLASRYLDLEGQTEEACIRSTASIAGKMADAMLAERAKE